MITSQYDPREHIPTHVEIIRTDLTHSPAYTDGHRTIWLAIGLTQAEERCCLTHELIHIERGHHGHQSRVTEEDVRHETARRLLPALDGIPPGMPLADAAEELNVTVDVLEDRILAIRRAGHPLDSRYPWDWPDHPVEGTPARGLTARLMPPGWKPRLPRGIYYHPSTPRKR